jgi:uncharacterized protein YndB with AHSA1/START domain
MQQRGELRLENGQATLIFRRTYPHSPARVWDAISTPEGLCGWLVCSGAVIDLRVGGLIEMISGPASYRSSGRVLAVEPERLFEYEWNVEPVPEMPDGERAIFRFELTPTKLGERAATELLVVYRRISLATARGFLPGVHAFLDRLEAQLDGNAPPDWLERFSLLRAEYPEWSQHATTKDSDATEP